ncbi:DUF416 family protein [Paenarthrobacter sp. DKR-5]|uniref:DUF416 family protein n=1 Tax=Paenarthrobacter sp. DKR-5 TaxID=2835535 RepID=UPI001BDD6707|nr:DUF416 family protein [Paenarthrobacter sp. DKR-5]MBT1001632.1 DUF416 family protein [Paenarthrobacter sp. DKR-5]
MNYDREAILERVSHMSGPAKTAFAACCAQRLLPLFERYTLRTAQGNYAALQQVLDDVWFSLAGGSPDLAAGQAVAESLVPNDFGDWVFEMAYGQNAAAAVAYAARVAISGDPDECEAAASQVYEAADSAAQELLPDVRIVTPEYNVELLSHPLTQRALQGICLDLQRSQAEAEGPRDWRALKLATIDEGRTWAESMP